MSDGNLMEYDEMLGVADLPWSFFRSENFCAGFFLDPIFFFICEFLRLNFFQIFSCIERPKRKKKFHNLFRILRIQPDIHLTLRAMHSHEEDKIIRKNPTWKILKA